MASQALVLERVGFTERVAAFVRARATRSVVSLADQAASSGATFLTGAIVGRHCPRDQFGVFMLSLTVLAWLTNIQMAFVTTPYIYTGAGLDPAARRTYAGSTLLHMLGYGVAATAVLAVISRLAPVQHNAGAAGTYTALAAVLLVLLAKEYCRQVAFAHLAVNSAFLLDAAVGVLQIGGLLAVARFTTLTGARVYGVIAGASLAPTAVWFAAHRALFRVDRGDVRAALVRGWSFGKWLFGGYLLNAASRDTYPWLLTAVWGASVTGGFSACAGVAYLVMPAITGIGNYLAPMLAKRYAAGGLAALTPLVRRITVLGLAVAAAYVLGMLCLGNRTATLIYGSAYPGDWRVIVLLAGGVGCTIASIGAGTGLYVMRRPDVNSKAAAAAVAVLLTVGVWLVRHYGPLGAAAAMLLGAAAESGTKFLLLARVVRSRAAQPVPAPA